MAKKQDKSKKSEKTQELINRHFTFIEVPVAAVGPETTLWGEAAWWPKKSSMKFIRQSEGELQIGTRYRQKVKGLFGPSWIVEVTKLIPNKLVEHTFRTGMIQGYEVIKIEERSNGTRVEYELHYTIRGLLNKILWPLLFRKQHDKNIEMILASLKEHLTKLADIHRERQLGD